MKPLFSCIFFSSILFLNSYGQVKDASVYLMQQAYIMGKSFMNGDYKTFVNYTYPFLLKSMGGSSKMVEVLNETNYDMKLKGMKFSNITFDLPSKIVKNRNELQATIAQHTEIITPQGRLVTTSTLIAISNDNGVNWTFFDTSNKDIILIRKLFPNLSPSIVIPAQQKPVWYNSCNNKTKQFQNIFV